MNLITSNQNSLIKDIKGLKVKKNREEKRLFFIEGTRFVEEALKEKAEIVYLFVSEKYYQSPEGMQTINSAKSIAGQIYTLSDKLYAEISDTDNPQGVMAVINMKQYELIHVLRAENNFIVVLDSIQDPGNMGTIIRTADAAGVNGIIISKGCVDLYNPKVLRSTMGSIFHTPVYFTNNLVETLNHIKSSGIKLYAAHLRGERNYYELESWDNTAVIIGNEANGIGEEVASCADELVKIPMAGRAESLNASVAAGLLMYEALRNRTK